tara:strand:+ start:632 stop:1051 length:420 start_codon:yes stop_codon:yes gene_type:complete
MKIILNNENASIPERADAHAAGYDLFACEDVIIKPWSRVLINTGVRLEIPEGYYGRIASRSGLGVKGFDIGAGVIDSNYRGEIKVVFINSTYTEKQISVKDKVAQIIFEKYYEFSLEPVQELSKTERGELGFGSTDVNK